MTDLERLLEFLDAAEISYFTEKKGFMMTEPVDLIITAVTIYLFQLNGKYVTCWDGRTLYEILAQKKAKPADYIGVRNHENE